MSIDGTANLHSHVTFLLKLSATLLPMTDAANILVVEDDQDIADLIALHFRKAGYQVETVYDGETGLERAVATPYDLVVLDVMLPKLRRRRGRSWGAG